jgi:hypothetical protein
MYTEHWEDIDNIKVGDTSRILNEWRDNGYESIGFLRIDNKVVFAFKQKYTG